MDFDNQNTKVSDNMFANIQKHKHENNKLLNGIRNGLRCYKFN